MMGVTMNRSRVLIPGAALLLSAQIGSAAETSRWIADTADEFLKGRGQNVEVTSDGVLRRVEGWSDGPDFEEPVVMAGARQAD